MSALVHAVAGEAAVGLFRLCIVPSIKLSEQTEIWYNLADVDQG